MDPTPSPDSSLTGPVGSGLNLTDTADLAKVQSLLDLLRDVDFVTLQIKLILGAMGIIFFGAYGSLRRPPSAARPKRAKGSLKTEDDNTFSQGLLPSDAIMLPIIAGVALIGLYYLIHWLDDPDILNKIVGWYLSIAGVLSLSTLYGHGLQLGATFIFPKQWKHKSGALVKVKPATETQLLLALDGTRTILRSPLPGRLSELATSRRADAALWKIRQILINPWCLNVKLYEWADNRIPLMSTEILGFFLSVATMLVYQATNSTTLSNIMGYGFCYGSFLMLSPTTFTTASLVLVGLFFYDIVMVFYT